MIGINPVQEISKEEIVSASLGSHRLFSKVLLPRPSLTVVTLLFPSSLRDSVSPVPDDTLGAAERARREKRMRRFEPDEPVVKASPRIQYTPPVYNADVIDWDEYTIVGTCTKLEKGYLRLTSVRSHSYPKRMKE